ncbi:MAG: hypothetical protein EP298_05460 [Gammaproteobacteria bacterium]|nr:MAG: hypothetical protein EP298_05460 [Gammaproteobacteria bacterium]UTW43245.1 hypothetical protein KFE69_03625 [bacterium SCSIO 12844]
MPYRGDAKTNLINQLSELNKPPYDLGDEVKLFKKNINSKLDSDKDKKLIDDYLIDIKNILNAKDANKSERLINLSHYLQYQNWMLGNNIPKYLDIDDNEENINQSINFESNSETVAEGYDEEGYDDEGYDDEGYDDEGYDDEGYDDEGYDGDIEDGDKTQWSRILNNHKKLDLSANNIIKNLMNIDTITLIDTIKNELNISKKNNLEPNDNNQFLFYYRDQDQSNNSNDFDR